MEADDFRFLKAVTKQERQKRLDKFMNEILDDIIMQSPKILSYQYFENEQRFVFSSTGGKFTYYPMKDKILNHSKSKWSENGLKKILEYINQKPTKK